jgi:thymidylate kinase
MSHKRNVKGTLVCFVGIDGSGKTTLANSLIANCKRHGITCRYVWGGFNSSFTVFKPLIAIAKSTVFRGNRFMEQSRTRGRVVTNTLLSTIYQYLMLVDYVFQAFFKIRVPLAFGRNVVCDRYIYDLVASIAVILGYSSPRAHNLLDRSLAALPRPHVVFLVDLPVELALKRKDDTIAVDSLPRRREIYLQMAHQHGMIVLDGTRDSGELAQLVTAEVLQCLTGE